MRIGLIGVHGVGKTTTAKLLSKMLNTKHCEIEVISKAYGMSPVPRQVMFFTEYTSKYVDIITRESSVIVDSHPLIVVPYTDYWVGKRGNDPKTASVLRDSMINMLTLLPKLDILVEIRPASSSTVISRVKTRRRFNLAEEANTEYIEFILERMKKYVEEYGLLLAKKVITVSAEIAPELRAETIVSEITAK